jgi:UDP-GlcNAc:undecaprenyl-phosphate GlcNAc-1-phosphate transferase
VSAVLAFAVAAVVTGVVAASVRTLAGKAGLVDPPNPRVPRHTRPVATLGGVAVAAGCGAGLATGLDGSVEPWLGIGAGLVLAAGVADDVHPLPIAAKLALQTLAAGAAVALGLELALTGNAFLDAVAAVGWILLVVNAVNLTDVCDGLVPGLAAIGFLALAAIEPGSSGSAIVAAGACVGFLALNAPPASIFLGDAGSHLVGFLLAALALEAAGGGESATNLVAPVLVLGVFLFELVFVVVERNRRGVPWWLGSDDHVALRLQAAGLSSIRTDLLLWTCAAALGLGGLLASRLESFTTLAPVLAAAVVAARAWRMLRVLDRPAAAPFAVRTGAAPPRRA